jgi:hypothetical protein
VLAAKMPLWSAGVLDHRGHPLSMPEIDTLVQWADEGAIAGDPKDAPPPAYFEETVLQSGASATSNNAR